MQLRPFALFLAISLAALSLGQKVVSLSKRDPDFKQIIAVLTPRAQTQAASRIRVTGEMTRRAGDWAFVRSSVPFVDPKVKVDGELMALLHKKQGKWTIVEETIGSGGMEDLAKDWIKAHHPPKGLIPRM